MFVNISNHPSTKWDNAQIEAAMQMSLPLVNIPFPLVNPEATDLDINNLVDAVCDQIESYTKVPTHAMVMGEFTLTLALVKRLQKMGIRCFAASTKREVVEEVNGTKTSVFKFVKFREYV